MTVKTTSNNIELKIVLACSFREYQWLQSFYPVIGISKVIGNRFSINDNNSSSMFNKNFRLCTFSFGVSIVFFSFIDFWFFYSFKKIGSLFKWKIIKLPFWINGHIFKIILENHVFVFCEYIEHLTFRMTIEIEWNSIQRKFSSCTWRYMQQLFFRDFLFWHILSWVNICSVNFFNVKIIPDNWALSESFFINNTVIILLFFLIAVFCRKFRIKSDVNFT